MLRVAITGGPGSGKSTIARLFAACGAHVVSSDEIARNLMQPGQPVYSTIVHHFGTGIITSDGALDRAALAHAAFAEGRVRELEAIVHPAVLAWQSEWAQQIAISEPHAVAMVESALVFESAYSGLEDGAMAGRRRFDRIILVTASDELKIRRFVQRALARNPSASPGKVEEDARRRLALQIPDAGKVSECDFVIVNETTLQGIEPQIRDIWKVLSEQAKQSESEAD